MSIRASTPPVSLNEKYNKITTTPLNRLARIGNNGKEGAVGIRPGGIGLFSSSAYKNLSERIERLTQERGRSIRILTLGDGCGTDALSIRYHQMLDYFLKNFWNKGLSVQQSDFGCQDCIDTATQKAAITRLDINKYPPQRLNSVLEAHFKDNNDVTEKLILETLSRNRASRLGDFIEQDLRDPKAKLPNADIVTVNQLVHYFDTIPPKSINPKEGFQPGKSNVLDSARTRFLKNVTGLQAPFIIFDDVPRYDVHRGRGLNATLLAEGYVPEIKPKKYSEEWKDSEFQGMIKSVNTVYQYKPQEAKQILAIYANRIKLAWKMMKAIKTR